MLWHNKLFHWRNLSISFQHWADSGFIFVYDFLDSNGKMKGSNEILSQLKVKTNWISEYTLVKLVLQQVLNQIDINIHMIPATTETEYNQTESLLPMEWSELKVNPRDFITIYWLK